LISLIRINACFVPVFTKNLSHLKHEMLAMKRAKSSAPPEIATKMASPADRAGLVKLCARHFHGSTMAHGKKASFLPVSLFDLESRFFAPTHTCWRPAQTGAVKVGRLDFTPQPLLSAA
jgi:hypothetical protein